MLVLRRKAGEVVVLNGVIKVYVLAVEGERVKLGFDAPPDVVIVRQELLDNDGTPAQSKANFCVRIVEHLRGWLAAWGSRRGAVLVAVSR
ncbi:MAG: carbon storage regulator [Ktedonobacterales bacterium]|nr:carbon storage regulator [Ktedonobacterales bacterium]